MKYYTNFDMSGLPIDNCPTISENIPTIGANKNWFINGIDSGYSSVGAQGEQGPQGEQGEPGPKGDTGEQGPQGPQGETGAVPNIQIGTVTTLDAGSNATVIRQENSSDEAPIFDFGIPKGDTGEQGETGSAGPQGEKGNDGITPNIQVGTVTTLSPENNATVIRRENSPDEAPIFDFGIPKGEKGEQGIQGEAGETGPMGPAPNVQVASVTTLAAGSDATVSRHEGSTDSNPTFDFGIPRGTTFTPNVSSEGVISWENDGGAENPEGKSIKGPKGDTGETGATGPTGPMGGFQLIGTARRGNSAPGFDYAIITSNIPGVTPYTGEIVLISDKGETNNAKVGDLWTINTTAPDTISGSAAYLLVDKIGNIRGPQGVAPNIGGDGYWYINGVKQDYPANGVDGNPVGTILAFMGTAAPDGYLICDGSTVAYSSYTALGNFFNTQFGSRNYFGGTTSNFMLPDLRDLFLRGYHGSAANPRSGDIGVRQGATLHQTIVMTNTKTLKVIGDELTRAISFPTHDADSHMTSATYDTAALTSAPLNGTQFGQFYESRPVNAAVLYCIKYV